MKNFKILGLIAMALMAMTASLGAGSASAAELYSTGETLPEGTEIAGGLESGTSAVLTTTDGKTLVDTCTGSSIAATATATAGESPVTTSIGSLSWSGCTVTTDTITNGSLSIAVSGAVTGTSSVVTVNFGGVSCRYGTGTGTGLGTLNTGKLAINAVVNEQEPKSFICPDTTRWVASYVVTSPHDLTVAAAVAEEVKVTLTAPKFKVGEELTIEAENSGNVEWIRTNETFSGEGHNPGAWGINFPESCTPKTLKAGEKCKRKLKCEGNGGKPPAITTWIYKVKSVKNNKPAEETIKIECT